MSIVTPAKKHGCCAIVYDGAWPFKCSKVGAYEHEGKHYCKVHHPLTIAEKDAARRERWSAECAARKKANAEQAEQMRRADCYPELLAALRLADEFIDGILEDLQRDRVADWYPEGAHNSATGMSYSMQLLANRCADFDAARAAIAKAEGAA
jgi:hypothetical protein